MTDPIGTAKVALSVAGELMRLAGDGPDVRAAGGELGKTALTVTKAINNALLPLAAVNFAFDKARNYFATRFNADLADKLKAVPEDQLVEPKASVAGPALQALAFSHEEQELRELYLSLLASAMDARVANRVHPAFVEIIRQLTAEEAQLLRNVLPDVGGVAVAELHLTVKAKPVGFVVVARHLFETRSQQPSTSRDTPGLSAIVDNWIRLGLVTVEYGTHLVSEGAYDWIEDNAEVVRLRSRCKRDGAKLNVRRGILTPTALGGQFAETVGIVDGARTA